MISSSWIPPQIRSCGGMFVLISHIIGVIVGHVHDITEVRRSSSSVVLCCCCWLCTARSLAMEGSNVAGGVKKEAVDAAAQGTPLLRAGGVVKKEPVDEPTDAGKDELRHEEAEASAAKRRREEESGDEAVGVGRKKRQRVVAEGLSLGRERKRDADPATRRTTTGADATAAAIVPQCRCSMLLSMPPLQRLLDACRDVFKGTPTPPSSIIVPFICRLMGRIGPHDVGLMDDLDYFHRMNAAARQTPPIITCKTIYSCSNFTIAVFFLPQRAVMPLHDHPGMTVFSKVLIGSTHVEAYDWLRPRVSGQGSPAAMLAEKVLDHNVTAASDAWVLFPDTGGNMHRFVVDGHCAFLDVLTPPYAPAEQRSCTYYEDLPYDELDPCAVSSGLTEAQRRRQLAWLREVPQPKDLRIANLPYQGPKIF
ncbi:hypothetical protein SETIT_9G152200v2 [Setaria italica]|uniref:cysteine dioxygenase n=1 Tax=Setaria italica TaxID=4555 RepID=A0A368SGS9_SETIT|nr:hypothetical protein SETIT_9G152200v2 [Setaria italica]